MAVERETVVNSDTDASEKRTREQLRNASISKASGGKQMAGEEVTQVGDTVEEHTSKVEEGGDVLEVVEGEEEKAPSEDPIRRGAGSHERQHSRKRSRDSTAEEDELNNGQRKSGERTRADSDSEPIVTSNGVLATDRMNRPRTPEQTGEKRREMAVEEMASPKTKRSRLESEPEKQDEVLSSSITTSHAPAESSSATKSPTVEKATTPIPEGSGFANTSTTSPFASLAGSKSPEPSAGAFAASGFGSLAGSTTSGFGSLGQTASGFGTGRSFTSNSDSKNENTEPATEQKSAFGGSLGQKSVFSAGATNGGLSSFGSSASGFGKLGQGSAFGGGGGFGGLSSLGGGGGLSSFASGKPSSSLAGPSKASKPFGTPADGDEVERDEGAAVEADDDAGFRSPLSQESDKQDERFYHQDLSTGEEDERTDYSCRAKLYNFVAGPEGGKKEWKERGLGVIRLNSRRASKDVEDSKPTARLLMRAEGSYRVILNTPIKKEIKFGAPDGGPPPGVYLYFMGAVEGGSGLEMLQLKMRQPFAAELYDRIKELQEDM